MIGRLTGKTPLITGGTTGIGLATAKLFLSEGARVAIIGQDAERVAATGRELGAGAIALRADVASASAMAGAAARVRGDFGTLDVVFANAGVAQPMPFADVDRENIETQIDVTQGCDPYHREHAAADEQAVEHRADLDRHDRKRRGRHERVCGHQGCGAFAGGMATI